MVRSPGKAEDESNTPGAKSSPKRASHPLMFLAVGICFWVVGAGFLYLALCQIRRPGAPGGWVGLTLPIWCFVFGLPLLSIGVRRMVRKESQKGI